MSDIDSSRRESLLLADWAASAAINVVLMYYIPGGETSPFHLICIGLAIVYGFVRWHPSMKALTMVAVAITTGYILLHHAALGAIGWEESTEVPLMSALFLM